jgi:hypothetical protein
MSQRFKLLDILTAVSVVVLLAGAAWMALWGPSGPLPMHFDVEGRPDRWGGRGEVAGLIAFLALVLAATAGGLGLYAGRTDDPARSRGLRIGQFITLIVVAGLAPILTAHILTFDAEPAAAGAAASSIWPLGVLGFIALATGALLGRVPPNAVIGRTDAVVAQEPAGLGSFQPAVRAADVLDRPDGTGRNARSRPSPSASGWHLGPWRRPPSGPSSRVGGSGTPMPTGSPSDFPGALR